MKNVLSQILRESRNKIEEFESHFEHFEKDPMILVKEVFQDHDLLLPILIQRYGDETLLQMQEYWYDLLFPKFKEYLGVDKIRFSYDKTIYPSPIYIHLDEDLIAVLDIVTHRFDKLELSIIADAKGRIKEIEKELKEVEATLKEKEPALKNPLVLGGANPIKLLDISIRNKKYKKEIRRDVYELQEYFFELEKEKIRINSSIEQVKQSNLEREYVLDKIERRIRKLPGYSSTNKKISRLDELKEMEELERGFSM